MGNSVRTGVLPLLAQVDPRELAPSGAASSGWVDISRYGSLIVVGQAGDLDGAEVAATLQQATSSGGAGAKTLAGGGALVEDAENFGIDIDPATLDINNGFQFVRVTLTADANAGAGALVAAAIFGANPKYAD